MIDRGEKCKTKEAARLRRNKENDQFQFLASLLPLQYEITKQLDKASVIRLAISYFKLREFFYFDPIKSIYEHNLDDRIDINIFLPSCLDGFMFILTHEAKFLYVSETVSALLGLSQVAVIGTYFEDYIHPEDKYEFRTFISECQHFKTTNQAFENISNKKRNFTIRFKSTLMKKAWYAKSNGWRLLQISGRPKFKLLESSVEFTGFFGMAVSIDSQISYEFELELSTFLIKLNMNLIIESFENLPRNLIQEGNTNIGKSIFHFINPIDLNCFLANLKELLSKEYVEFKYRICCNYESRVVNCKAVIIQRYGTYQANAAGDSLQGDDSSGLFKDFYQILLINDFIEQNSLELIMGYEHLESILVEYNEEKKRKHTWHKSRLAEEKSTVKQLRRHHEFEGEYYGICNMCIGNGDQNQF